MSQEFFDLEDLVESGGSWRNQEVVYIVMYQSRKSGGTYTEVRRTPRGLARLLETLRILGYKKEEISITEQQKKWMPDPNIKLKKPKTTAVPKKRRRKDDTAKEASVARGVSKETAEKSNVYKFVARG